ncbi:MAG: hypothetical protein DRJ66_04265 [Thermoprotei archaeon]|nr:MAG: hypothetical protein DRJ66_04265 [Thermoprotei archaeon]
MKKNTKRKVSILLVLVIATLFSLELVMGLNKTLATHNFSAQEKKIYVLCVREAGESWVDKNEMRSSVVGYLKALGLKCEVIESVDEWEALIKEAPEGVIIINCHGEVIPIPTSYGDDYESFYNDLAELIKNKGWIFVQMVGFGFCMVGNTKTVGESYGVEEEAIFRALGLEGLVDPWYTGTAELSGTLGKNVSKAIGVSIPETVAVDTAIAIAVDQLPEHVKVLWYWYKVPESEETWQGYPYLGVVALKIGKGILVWGGLVEMAGAGYGKMAALVTAYILNPKLAAMKVKLPLLTRKYIFIYSLVAVGAIFAAFGLALLFKRSVPPEGT